MMIMIHKDTGTDIDHNNIHVLYLYNSYNMSMIIIDVVCANDVNIYIYIYKYNSNICNIQNILTYTFSSPIMIIAPYNHKTSRLLQPLLNGFPGGLLVSIFPSSNSEKTCFSASNWRQKGGRSERIKHEKSLP